MTRKITESDVYDWYEKNYNTKPLFSRTKPALTLETSLSTGEYPWARETGDEIMKDYFQVFSVDDADFNFLSYWPYEKGFIPDLILPKSMRVAAKKAKPLTINMLIESAKAGRWLYD